MRHAVYMLQPISSVFLYFVKKLGYVVLQSLCLFYNLSKCILLFFSYIHNHLINSVGIFCTEPHSNGRKYKQNGKYGQTVIYSTDFTSPTFTIHNFSRTLRGALVYRTAPKRIT